MLGIFSKEEKTGNKKMIENLVLFLILFIIVIIVINSLGENKETTQINSVANQVVVSNKDKSLEEKIEDTLSLIDGAGRVSVLITYANGIEQVPMYNTKQNTTTIQESDTQGGVRKTEEINNEQNIIFNENGNTKTPVIKQTINPEIMGVIIVSEGAGNISVKQNLINALEALLNVPAHRVQVFARKS